MAVAKSVAVGLGLKVDVAHVIQNSNKVALRLLPCDVFARVALLGQGEAALEIALARRLAAVGSPVVTPEARVEPRVYDGDGFAITFWTYYEAASQAQLPAAEYADALHRLHAGMSRVLIQTPHFLDRVADAERLVANSERTPALNEEDRDLLVATLRGVGHEVQRRSGAEQLLHGEPHPGNILRTSDGSRFIDFETCCRGPVEFDVAHVPEDVSAHYPDIDRDLLQECRRLVLAMVAAWRWDVEDQFPHGQQHGRAILTVLRSGPPWPALGPLSAD